MITVVMCMKLVPYQEQYEGEMLPWIADFFGHHAALVGAEEAVNLEETRKTVTEWSNPPSALYVIEADGEPVGFLRLNFKGDIAAWLEDIYITPVKRGQGLAEAAIGMAEELVRGRAGYRALCLDVAPRNESALRLYHRLGFTDLSLITLRKEFGESPREKPLSMLGLEFHY